VTPSDVAGVLSRYFIVGFFVPTFFALSALAFGASSDALPDDLEAYSDGAKIAIVGGSALLVGLALMGLNYQVMRAFEGYPLMAHASNRAVKPVYDWLVARQEAANDELVRVRDDAARPDADRNDAAWRLGFRYSDRLLPTGFGNVVRAFERQSRVRWGLNSISAWPRIDLLLNDQEREIEANHRGEVGFFLNGCLLGTVVGLLLLADLLIHQTVPAYWAWAYLIPFGLAYGMYRASIGAAIRWGSVVKAAIDLHRLELYKLLGLREPVSFTEERDVLAPAVNRFLLYAEPLPDELRVPADDNGDEEVDEDE